MEPSELKNLADETEVPIEDPRFYSKIYKILCEREGAAAKEEYEELSRQLDASLLQESCSVRNILKTRALANYLIDEEGEMDMGRVSEMIHHLKKKLYSLGPERQHDSKRQERILKMLTLLQDNPKLARQLKTISKPHQHRIAEQIIRDTLQLPAKTAITNGHTRRAVLSALLCYLRQNVGSCFATAPAIIVHHEQPDVFLRDIQELLATGQLKRIFGGVEYAVPLSYTWGAGDLRKGFFFPKTGYVDDIPIWRSPGLITALESVGIIGETRSLSEKRKKCKELVSNALKRWEAPGEWFFGSMEETLRLILLNHLDLTKGDIEEYQLRPQGMMIGSTLMRLPVEAKESGSKNQRCQQFLVQFEQAKNVFKSFSDNALLKTWEFTLASFAETKAEFTRWNLYSSLGLRPDDKGGIGPCLYEILKRKLEESNEKAQQYQADYEQLYAQIQFLQRKSRNIESERDAQWVRIEYQTKSSEFYTIEALRDEWHNKARRYSNLFDGLVDLYYRLFPKYFQEVYDADIHGVLQGPYDDSPAGFRLLYKYGRSNTSQWTLIHNHIEFIDALANFFIATENDLAHSPELKGLESDLAEITTSIVTHVRSPHFIESAFHRMAQVHGAPIVKDPLNNLDKIQKKPWVYTSGGAVTTLVSCYFRLEGKPREAARWVESPSELLVFLIDAVKEIPHTFSDEVLQNFELPILVHSPTHAFLLKPGYSKFREGWQSRDFTYTWVRDTIIRPMEQFVKNIYLDDVKIKYVVDVLLEKVPHHLRRYFKETFYEIGGSMQVKDFRNHVLETIEMTQGLRYGGRGALLPEDIDSALFSLLPLFPSYKLKEQAEKVIQRLPAMKEERKALMLELLADLSGKMGAPQIINAKGFQEIIKALIALTAASVSSSLDYHAIVSQIAQEEGFAIPTPFIFADTNWVKDYFAFTVNPGTGKFELWRTDYIGSEGAPMRDWEMWVDGSRRDPKWGVFNRPYEYRF